MPGLNVNPKSEQHCNSRRNRCGATRSPAAGARVLRRRPMPLSNMACIQRPGNRRRMPYRMQR
eukprot:10272098-Lingulodinium_polyedra.AAC.1